MTRHRGAPGRCLEVEGGQAVEDSEAEGATLVSSFGEGEKDAHQGHPRG